jgi:hypothetical protein
MNLTTSQKLNRFSARFFEKLRGRSVNVFTLMMLAALIGLECFSFSTTEFALGNMLGSLGMGSMRWSTILSIAFCGMDLAGISRLLTLEGSESGKDKGSWFLLGAWVLAAGMNACLTWWGVSVAIYNQPADSVFILDPLTFVTAVPVMVSLGVWIIRILIIGSLVYSFNPNLGKQPIRKARGQKRSFGFKDTPQAVPSGYTPINTQARSNNEPFRF